MLHSEKMGGGGNMDLMEIHHHFVHHCIKPDGMTNAVLYSLTHNTLIYKIRCQLKCHAVLTVFYIHFV